MSMRHYPLFWLNGNNFGDMLSPLLYEHITGREPIHSNMSPRILACGSILGRARADDIIWGSGFLDETGRPKSSKLIIKYVRGPLSARILRERGFNVPDIYGDPGLLLHRYVHKSDERYDVGFFPHYTNAGARITSMPNSVRMKPMAPVLHTLSQLTACMCVVSSALHGIVAAESFGIPAVWVRISNSVPEFKFRDYYRGTGRTPPKPIDWTHGAKWKPVMDAFDRWTPPVYSEDDILACCPFNLERKGK